MCKFVLGLCVAIWLAVMGGGNAYAASDQANPAIPRPEQAQSLGDETLSLAFPDVSRIDPRLAFLGAGVFIGLAIASPGIELGEILGIALGVVGSQYLYYSLAPRLPPGLRPNP